MLDIARLELRAASDDETFESLGRQKFLAKAESRRKTVRNAGASTKNEHCFLFNQFCYLGMRLALGQTF